MLELKPLRGTKDRGCMQRTMRVNVSEPINISPALRGLLPGLRVMVTPALWHAIGATGSMAAEVDRLRDLGFYSLFALAGLVGKDDEHAKGVIVPVAFESSGVSQIRIVVGRDKHEKPSLTLSLPEEKVSA
jgi:hypothetical protein